MELDKLQPSQFFTLKRILKGALRDYGGWAAIVQSPFLWISVVLSAVSYNAWISGAWASSTLSIIPNLLGFSLGTYALLFSLMSNRLKLALRAIKNSNGISYLNEINSTFLYFISVQILVLIWAFLYQQTLLFDMFKLFGVCRIASNPLFYMPSFIGGYLGTVALIYSFLLVIASSLAIYRLARIVDPSLD
jgi:hypothetical protein